MSTTAWVRAMELEAAMKLISVSPFLSVIVATALALSPVYGQMPAPESAPGADDRSAPTLELTLIDSDGPQAQISSRTQKGFTVRVADAAGTAVSDAAVSLRLPDNGPTGAFADGRHSAVVYTGADGRATFTGIQWAGTPGVVAMRVTATKDTSHAGMLIEETLAPVTGAAPGSTAAAAPPSQNSTTTVVVQPRAPAQPATPQSVGKTLSPSPQDTSAAHPLAVQHAAPQSAPSVSVTSAPPGEAPHSSHAKWFIIAAIAVGAGAGVAMAGKGKKSNPAAAVSSLDIGAPSISVGPGH